MGDFYVQMAKMAQRRLDEIKAQNFANNEWAFATGGQKEELLFNELARLAERHLDGVNKLGLANNAWAIASLMCGVSKDGLGSVLFLLCPLCPSGWGLS